MKPHRPEHLFALLLLGLWIPCIPLAAQEPDGPSLIVLVRHAERAGPSAEDPGLTELGSERARELSRLLADAGITRIHSSDTRRTRDTAAPLAERLALPVELYDHRALEDFAKALLDQGGRHLVVGHSNTTDELAVHLGGTSHGEIVEAWEYDRLYLLTPRPAGGMETVVIRFGPRVNRP
jgi:2,3-bisphosphoglycerate-dependent phosphoglycerate mutase